MRKHEESDAPVPPRAFAIKNAFQNAWLVSASGQMRPWRLLSFTICHWGLSDLGGSNLCSDLREAAIHGGGVGFDMSFFSRYVILDKSA